jgi:hypothetical protein
VSICPDDFGPRWAELAAVRSGDAEAFVAIGIEVALDQGEPGQSPK